MANFTVIAHGGGAAFVSTTSENAPETKFAAAIVEVALDIARIDPSVTPPAAAKACARAAES